MWAAQNNYWEDYYTLQPGEEADYSEQWYTDRDNLKKVATNPLYTAMLSAEAAFYGDESATPVVAGIL